jgi:hypothetical protein
LLAITQDEHQFGDHRCCCKWEGVLHNPIDQIGFLFIGRLGKTSRQPKEILSPKFRTWECVNWDTVPESLAFH